MTAKPKKPLRCLGCYRLFTLTEAANAGPGHDFVPTDWDFRMQLNWAEVRLLMNAAQFVCVHGDIPSDDRKNLVAVMQRLMDKEPHDAALVALAINAPHSEYVN